MAETTVVKTYSAGSAVVETSQSLFLAALIKARSEFPAIHKDAKNPHFNSKYATLDEILTKITPTLTANGLAIVTWFQVFEGEQCLSARLMHVGGGGSESSFVRLLVDRQNMQGLGSAITYARRYIISTLLQLSIDADDDGNAASGLGHTDNKAASAPPPSAKQPVTFEAVHRGTLKQTTPAAMLSYVERAAKSSELRRNVALWAKCVNESIGPTVNSKIESGEWTEDDTEELQRWMLRAEGELTDL